MIKSWTAENVEIALRDVSDLTLSFYSAFLMLAVLSRAHGPHRRKTWIP